MQEGIIDIRRLDGGILQIRHATEMAQVFFRVDPSVVGPECYDSLVAVTSRDRIEESDIHAINGTMAARSPLSY